VDLPVSTTVTINWTGAASGQTIGGLDLTVDYDETAVAYASAITGSLTTGWLTTPNNNGDTVRAGMIGTSSFDGGTTTGSVLVLTFNVTSGVPTAGDFVITTISYVDGSYNTINLTAGDVSVSIVNNY
jgi:hypothetical protein